MPGEIGIIASLPIAPGKLEKAQALFEEVFRYILENEPDSLEFTIYKQETKDGVTLLLHERYASPEALTKHQSSKNHAAVFEKMTTEEMLAGEPTIMQGTWFQGLKR